MKKYFAILAAAIVAFAACKKADDPAAVKGVKLDQTTLAIYVGNTATLIATVEPKTAVNTKISWKSDNEAVATVANGVVSGVTKGKAIITVTTEEGGFTATCAVEVKEIAWTKVYNDEFTSNSVRTILAPNAPWILYNNSPALPGGLSWTNSTPENPWVASNTACLYASSYWSGPYECEAWLVSPEIDLTDAAFAKFNFKNVYQYVNDPANELGVYVAESVEQVALGQQEGIWWGGPVGIRPNGTFEQVVVPNIHKATNGYDFEDSGDCIINDYAGMKIRLAFKYIGTTAGAGTWAIDDLEVYAGK